MSGFTVELMFPGKYVKAEDLNGKASTVVIESIVKEDLIIKGGKKKPSWVATMKGKTKHFVLCKTNVLSLAVLHGSTLECWLNKKIVLIPDVDMCGREEVACIRIQGSPEAPPERAAAYAKAWKGERMRGELAARLKDAKERLDKRPPPVRQPVEKAEVDPEDKEEAGKSASQASEDTWDEGRL